MCFNCFVFNHTVIIYLKPQVTDLTCCYFPKLTQFAHHVQERTIQFYYSCSFCSVTSFSKFCNDIKKVTGIGVLLLDLYAVTDITIAGETSVNCEEKPFKMDDLIIYFLFYNCCDLQGIKNTFFFLGWWCVCVCMHVFYGISSWLNKQKVDFYFLLIIIHYWKNCKFCTDQVRGHQCSSIMCLTGEFALKEYFIFS